MKLAAKSLLLLFALAATLAYAQSQVKNVIVVMQENRTPDNLFQGLCTANNSNPGCGTGSNQFNITPYQTGGSCHGTQVAPLQARPLQDCAGPDHWHDPSWLAMYDHGHMDGACDIKVSWGNCGGNCPCEYMCPSNLKETDCTQYAYVQNTSSDPTIQPYLDTAEPYGFANYMFQTNEGPSFPAHQFLFSGTSAPAPPPPPGQTDLYQYFGAENTVGCQGQNCDNSEDAGCIATSGVTTALVDTAGNETLNIYPCFDHPTLTDLLDNNTPKIPWRYYGDQAASIWTAPNAISHICMETSTGSGEQCTGGDWDNNVMPNLEGSVRYIDNTYKTTLAPALYDLSTCNFPSTWSGGVIFITPDGRWSDHARNNIGLGPSWVADIVNVIGTSNCTGNMPNWGNTVILITWDDWGGWWDHASPSGPNGPGIGYSNGTGGSYVYGFRVPLIVVSAYVNATDPLGGYISNYTYDFGSILKFIENTYSITSDIDPNYHYADWFAGQRTNGDLSDFFNYNQQQRSFTQINLQYQSACTVNTCGATKCNNQGACQCDTSCFIHYQGSPRDPDDN